MCRHVATGNSPGAPWQRWPDPNPQGSGKDLGRSSPSLRRINRRRGPAKAGLLHILVAPGSRLRRDTDAPKNPPGTKPDFRHGPTISVGRTRYHPARRGESMAEKAIGAASILLVGAVMAWLCGRASQEVGGIDPTPVRIGVMAVAVIITAVVWRRH